MGFPGGYTEVILPKLCVRALWLLGFIRKLVCFFFRSLGLGEILEPHIVWSDQPTPKTEFRSVSALLIRKILPVVKFSELVDPPESCAVCLSDFEVEDDIRRLTNCRHIFHRGCLDRWMGYDQRTCPLCRTSFIPEEMEGAFNEMLWAASGIPEFYGELSHIPNGL